VLSCTLIWGVQEHALGVNTCHRAGDASMFCVDVMCMCFVDVIRHVYVICMSYVRCHPVDDACVNTCPSAGDVSVWCVCVICLCDVSVLCIVIRHVSCEYCVCCYESRRDSAGACAAHPDVYSWQWCVCVVCLCYVWCVYHVWLVMCLCCVSALCLCVCAVCHVWLVMCLWCASVLCLCVMRKLFVTGVVFVLCVCDVCRWYIHVLQVCDVSLVRCLCRVSVLRWSVVYLSYAMCHCHVYVMCLDACVDVHQVLSSCW